MLGCHLRVINGAVALNPLIALALCHEKSQILIITNKDFFLLCLMALKSDLNGAKVISRRLMALWHSNLI